MLPPPTTHGQTGCQRQQTSATSLAIELHDGPDRCRSPDLHQTLRRPELEEDSPIAIGSALGFVSNGRTVSNASGQNTLITDLRFDPLLAKCGGAPAALRDQVARSSRAGGAPRTGQRANMVTLRRRVQASKHLIQAPGKPVFRGHVDFIDTPACVGHRPEWSSGLAASLLRLIMPAFPCRGSGFSQDEAFPPATARPGHRRKFSRALASSRLPAALMNLGRRPPASPWGRGCATPDQGLPLSCP